MFVCPVCASSFQAGGFCTEDGASLVDGASDPLLGTNVGSYRLAKLIGRGGMGAVYLGIHPGIGSRVAIKVLSPGASMDPTLVDRFFAEARSVNVIRHESIVNVLDLSVLPDGRPCITMEYLEGASLARHFAEARPSTLEFVARVGIEILGALSAAHALGITHRDLKPDNVFVTSLGRVKVLDFGIAKLRPEEGREHDGTRTGTLLGTPQYMSPEQALGQPVDPRSDLYSLGAILFEGVTGQRLYQADSLFELLRCHIQEPPRSPRSLRQDLPPAFENLILRLLEKDRARRIQTAAECKEALALILPEARGAASVPPTAASPGVVPPTIAATAVTLGTPSQPQSAKGSSIGLYIGIGGLLIAVIGIVVGGIALVGAGMLGWANARPTSSSAPPPPPDTTLAPAPPQPTTTTTTSDPAPLQNAKTIDPTTEIKNARTEARKVFTDSELVSFSLVGIDASGKLKLDTAQKSIGYVFRSPKQSQNGKKCMVMVSASMYGTFASAYEDTVYEYKSPTLVAPRCPVSRVVKEEAGNQPISSVSFQNQQGAWQWIVMIKGGAMRIRPDNC
jgi:serine/threonine protein kinase